MQTTLFNQQLLAAKSAQDVVGVVQRDMPAKIRELGIYVVFGTGTTAGTILVESAHDPDYTGTWATVATIAWSAATKVGYAAITGVHRALRVRISVAVVNGTVDAYGVAN